MEDKNLMCFLGNLSDYQEKMLTINKPTLKKTTPEMKTVIIVLGDTLSAQIFKEIYHIHKS